MRKNNSRKPFFSQDKQAKKGEDSNESKGFESKKKSFGSFDKKGKDTRGKFEKEEGKAPFKKRFEEGERPKFEKGAKRSEKRFFGEGEKEFEKNQSKDFKSSKRVYLGRGKDQKPIYGERTADFSEKKSVKRGFGKNRPSRIQNSEVVRPEYEFDNLPKGKKKNSGDDLIRLNKYIANSGICSRREADELIAQGLVSVNGQVVTELGMKVQRNDRVVYNGKRINPEKPVYILLNKPKDFITTTEDPMERKTVMKLVENACEERIFPVGRLDRNTTGLLLFTNDGELAAKLSHPSNEIKKIYQVTLDKPLTKNDEEAIREGLTLEDGPAAVDDLQVLSLDRKILGLEIHIGRNRIVRRIFAHLGYDVVALDRVLYAGLDKKDLKRGNYRFLTEKEVMRLKFFS
ncbi:MAG: rRNA pseudouridine synthase [Algoriphagus sp.]|uniref:pseudouridine synthase n=1 Tax=Algoriphagus sp. TaxID=1872435 RepID=UPI0017991CFC|nr:pseudouridine synthase [Algoriphagus sp.]NVJ85488.1 rRNA pseudouridine synthase [Algoriphagus sp.]